MKTLIKSSIRFVFSLLALFMVSSCTDLEDDFQPDTQKSISFNGALCEFGNICNPYCTYGLAHNLVVQQVMEQKDYILEMVENVSQLKPFVVDKTETILETLYVDDPDYDPVEVIDWNDFYDADLSDLDALLLASELTSYEQQILSDYFEQITNFDLYTDEGFDAFISYTEELECSLYDDNQITNLSGMYTALSINKHSAGFWINDSGMQQIEGIIGIIVADAFGAIYGYTSTKKKRTLAYAIAFSLTMGLAILI